MDSLMLALRVLVSLAVVVALVWYLARRLGRRGGDTSREAEVRVLDRQSLSRRAGLAVVAAGDRRLLVGFSESSVELLTELAPVPAPPKGIVTTSSAAALGSSAGSSSPVPAAGRALGVPTHLPGRLPSPRTTSPAPAGPGDGPPHNRRPGLLAGSVLSPATWQATVRAMQDRTVRR